MGERDGFEVVVVPPFELRGDDQSAARRSATSSEGATWPAPQSYSDGR